MLEARKNRGMSCHVYKWKCFYDIEEDVEMHIMKKKENNKDGYTKTESHDQSLFFFYEFTRQLNLDIKMPQSLNIATLENNT